MDFTQKQLQTLKEGFAREKMQQASQQPRVKKPRIYTPRYEKVDITTIPSYNTTINKSRKRDIFIEVDIKDVAPVKIPFTYVFGKKVYINNDDMKLYEGFTIYYE